MPRHARVFSQKQVYHVMLRGNDRQNIFIDDEDKKRIVDILIEKKNDSLYYIYAFCVMDNHIHLIIKEGADSLSRAIKRIAISYALYFNKKYKRIGHVFQDRYKSENIEDDRYLLSAIRYVHQNPLKAGLSSIDEYYLSSYREYLGDKIIVTDTDEILEMISKNKDAALKEFVRLSHVNTGDLLIDVPDDKEIDEDLVEYYIKTYLNERNISLIDLKNNSNQWMVRELVGLLLQKTTLSRRGIANVLGLNRETVRKTALSVEPSL
ncbi:MAG: transposase [Desulfocucumaceae bacterium]